MRLLVQSDDYGITKAQAAGCIEGIKNGLIRNTGLFVNMPWSAECVRWIYPLLDQIALGIDLNASTGSSVLGYEAVPSLCHTDGLFLTSSENRALDNEENGFDHVNYEDLYREFDAQIHKFLELVGRMPDYLHAHAYQTKTTMQVIRDLSEKYHRPFTFDFMETYVHEKYAKMTWVKRGDANEQLKSDLKSYLLRDEAGFLGKETGYLVTHCGYVDAELMEISSFNLVRMKDLEALTSQEVKQWVKENNIELITFKDLAKEYEDQGVY